MRNCGYTGGRWGMSRYLPRGWGSCHSSKAYLMRRGGVIFCSSELGLGEEWWDGGCITISLNYKHQISSASINLLSWLTVDTYIWVSQLKVFSRCWALLIFLWPSDRSCHSLNVEIYFISIFGSTSYLTLLITLLFGWGFNHCYFNESIRNITKDESNRCI
jgi:hypothetical protein